MIEGSPRGAERKRAHRLNFLGGAAGYVVVVLLGFWTRTALVGSLSLEYVALNAILLNLVSVVSIAEAGIITAAMFRLYGPLAKGDDEAVSRWLRAARFYYRCALVVIAVLGIVVTFLLPLVTRDLGLHGPSVVGLFWLAMAHALALCVLATDKVLLLADQRNYLVVLLQAVTLLLQSALQVLVLVETGSFALFLVIQAAGTLLWNISSAVLSRRLYPKAFFAGRVSRQERRELGRDVWHLFPYKLGAVGLNATYAILISVLVRATLAGIVSNYALVVNSVNGVLMQAFNGMAAAIGMHTVEADADRRTRVFFQMTMLSIWLFGASAISLAVLLNPFIELWLGSDYLLATGDVIALVGVFYVTGTNQVPSLYRSSLGIFRKTRYVPLVAVMLNVFLSVVLVKYVGLGLMGIFLATIAARVFTFSVVDPVLVSRLSLETGSLVYFTRVARAGLGVALVWWLASWVSRSLSLSGYLGFALLAPTVALLSAGSLACWLSMDVHFRHLLGRVRRGV